MNALDMIKAMPQYMRESLELARGVRFDADFSNVLVCGMGGSGIPGDILRSLCNDAKVPIITNRDYTIPGFVNSGTLAIILSYSGDTEESMSALKECARKGAKLLVMTSGASLKFAAEKAGVDRSKIISLPKGMPPRFALPFLITPLMLILHNMRIVKLNAQDIKDTIETLQNDTFVQTAQQLSELIVNKTVLVYASTRYEAACRRWCHQLNENAKRLAFWNTLPEQNHNELIGFRNPPENLHVVLLTDEKDHPQVIKRIGLTKDIIKQSGITMTELGLKGQSHMVKLFTALYVGDLVSYFVAQRAGIDPIETQVIDDLKKRL